MQRNMQERPNDEEECDFVLTDANGRSVRVHKALLIDKSDYFAQLFSENNLTELQLDENYLLEMIRYLYNHEGDSPYMSPQSTSFSADDEHIVNIQNNHSLNEESKNCLNGDIEILMHLLCLSKRYYFNQLYVNILNEIECKISPATVVTVYKLSKELDLCEVVDSTRLLILSWLPQVQKAETFLSLTVEYIYDIFESEENDIDNECKLNALSAWWAQNKDQDMTNLWLKLIGCPKSNREDLQ